MLRPLLVLSFLAALAAAGCGPMEVTVDGGPAADAGGPAGLIELESEPMLALTFGQSADLAVRYTEDGRAVPGTQVRFALEGVAHDSALTDLSLTTDAEGRARTSVVAGSVTAVFRVRVIADRAAPGYVNVSVSNEGFGGLTVGAVYAGTRADGAVRRVIQIYSDTSCDSPDGFPRSAARMATLVSDEETEHRFGALPAGLTYTVAGRVEGPSGAALATACVDGVMVTRDGESRVDLDFSDSVLVLDGRYETTLELTSPDTPGPVGERGVDAGVGFVAGDGAGLYLDALEQALRDRGETAAADALVAERVGAVADDALRARLVAAGAGPSEAVTALFARITERLEVVRVTGPLALSTTAGLDASWSIDAIELGAVGVPDGPAAIPIDPAVAMIDPAPVLRVSLDPTRDVLDVEAIELSLPLGSLVVAAMTSLADGLASPGEILTDGAGCDVLATWVSESTTFGPACDASCAEAACAAALGGLLEPVRTALLEADASRSTVKVSGEIRLHDDNADLLTDRLEGTDLAGSWLGPLGLDGDVLSGALSGDRMVD